MLDYVEGASGLPFDSLFDAAYLGGYDPVPPTEDEKVYVEGMACTHHRSSEQYKILLLSLTRKLKSGHPILLRMFEEYSKRHGVEDKKFLDLPRAIKYMPLIASFGKSPGISHLFLCSITSEHLCSKTDAELITSVQRDERLSVVLAPIIYGKTINAVCQVLPLVNDLKGLYRRYYA